MYNNGRETGGWNPEEGGGETVQGDDDNNCGQDTSSGGAHTGFGLQSGTRERTSGGISRKAGTDEIGDTDGDELLVGVDFVAIKAAKC